MKTKILALALTAVPLTASLSADCTGQTSGCTFTTQLQCVKDHLECKIPSGATKWVSQPAPSGSVCPPPKTHVAKTTGCAKKWKQNAEFLCDDPAPGDCGEKAPDPNCNTP